MAFPRAKQINHSFMLLWPKLIHFQVKKHLAVGLWQNQYLAHPLGDLSLTGHLPQVLHLLYCPHSKWVASKLLERRDWPVSSLWTLPCPVLSWRQSGTCQKTRHFSKRLYYFLAGPAVNPWYLKGFTFLVLTSQDVAVTLFYHLQYFFAGEDKASTAKTYPASIGWSLDIGWHYLDGPF